MKTETRPGESMVKEGPANLQRGIEAVGGKLSLTDQRLVFESHALNVQTGATEIELANVTGTETCWTKFLGLVPIAPNSLAVRTEGGEDYRFVLWGRDSWITAIEGQLAART